MATVKNTKITPSTWNGTYPLSDLPSGDLWYGPYVVGSAEYWSCIGFARMVLDATYGAGNSISYTSFSNANSVKNAFSSIPTGSRVTFNVKNTDNGKHGIIVAGKSNDDITIYDCNWDANDKISYRTWNWNTILSKYSSISSGVKPA